MLSVNTVCSMDLDGDMETVCDRVPILSARSCGATASRGKYMRLGPFSASRGGAKSYCETPYIVTSSTWKFRRFAKPDVNRSGKGLHHFVARTVANR